jgi:hypothetical protein
VWSSGFSMPDGVPILGQHGDEVRMQVRINDSGH